MTPPDSSRRSYLWDIYGLLAFLSFNFRLQRGTKYHSKIPSTMAAFAGNMSVWDSVMDMERTSDD